MRRHQELEESDPDGIAKARLRASAVRVIKIQTTSGEAAEAGRWAPATTGKILTSSARTFCRDQKACVGDEP